MHKDRRLPRGASIRDRLLAYSDFDAETGCRIWMGACSGTGYGTLTHKREIFSTHRLSFEEFVGPIPDGLCVCHHCDTPPCIAPKHLFLGTHQDNRLDSIAKGRGRILKGEDCGAAMLTNKNVLSIAHYLSNTGLTQARIASKFDISRSSIDLINRGGSWGHLTKATRAEPLRPKRCSR